jgi:hypothetical protein
MVATVATCTVQFRKTLGVSESKEWSVAPSTASPIPTA